MVSQRTSSTLQMKKHKPGLCPDFNIYNVTLVLTASNLMRAKLVFVHRYFANYAMSFVAAKFFQIPVLTGDINVCPNKFTSDFIDTCSTFGDMIEVRVGWK